MGQIGQLADLAYLDFSTLAERETDCRAELTLNRRLAPDVYLRVAPLVLVWAWCQGQDCRAAEFLCSSEERFFVASTGFHTRRARPRSSLTEGHRRRRRAAGCVLGMPGVLGVKVPCAT